MPWTPNGANGEFAMGVTHVVNAAKANENSITLGGPLQRDAVGQVAADPHAVLSNALGSSGQDDGSWERLQRLQGGYQPGSMEQMQDQLNQGTNNS